MIGLNDRLVAFRDIVRNGVGGRVDVTEEVQFQRGTIEELVHVQQDGVGAGLAEPRLAGLHRLPLVSKEAVRQPFVGVCGWSKYPVGGICGHRLVARRENFRNFNSAR